MFCQELNSMLCSTCSVFKPLLYKGEWPLKKMGREGSNMTDFFQRLEHFLQKRTAFSLKAASTLWGGEMKQTTQEVAIQERLTL